MLSRRGVIAVCLVALLPVGSLAVPPRMAVAAVTEIDPGSPAERVVPSGAYTAAEPTSATAPVAAVKPPVGDPRRARADAADKAQAAEAAQALEQTKVKAVDGATEPVQMQPQGAHPAVLLDGVLVVDPGSGSTVEPDQPTPSESAAPEPSESPAPVASAESARAGQRSAVKSKVAVPAAPDAAALVAPDPCAPVGTEAWYATYSGGDVITTPTANKAGTARLTVTNRGNNTWPAGHTFLGYHLFNANNVEIAGTFPRTAVSGAVSRGGSVTVNATIAALVPGVWKVVWDIYLDNGVGWFSNNNVCTWTVQYTVHNQPPNLRMDFPANASTVLTRTPTLFAYGADPDGWPVTGKPMALDFIACLDAALTVGCKSSGWRNISAFDVPVGTVAWNQSFYWSARASDSDLSTPASGWAPPNKVTVTVPVPDPWRTIGAGLGMASVGGVILPYGTWVYSDTDAVVSAVGVPLQVQRTYSSSATNVVGAFGRSWLSMFDARAEYGFDGNTVTVTLPDGRQETFGKQGSGWVSRAESGSTDKLTVWLDGTISVRQANQELLMYSPGGPLRSIEHTGTGSLVFNRDGSAQVSSVTQFPSGRQLSLHWDSDTAAGCPAGRPPVISRVTDELGHAWDYFYDCDELASVCDPTEHCVQYSTTVHPISAFRRSAAGRTIARPVESDWVPATNSTKADSKSISVQNPNGSRVQLTFRRQNASFRQQYLDTYNDLGGVTVSVDEFLTGATSGAPQLQQTYLFDQSNRLRTLLHGAYTDKGAVKRSWLYNLDPTPNAPNFGQFMGMIDENWNNFELHYDAYGNMTSKFQFRDPDTQVTYGSQFWPVPGGLSDNTRMERTFVSPNQSGQNQQDPMFTYDSDGRLVQRLGNPTPENPDGAALKYTYTQNTEAAFGPVRGGSLGNAAQLPSGLLKSTAADTSSTTFDYNSNGDVTRVTDTTGKRTVYDYDQLGRRISQTVFTAAFPNGAQTKFVLDQLGRVVEEIAPATTNAVTGASQQLRTCRRYDPDSLLVATTLTAAASCPAAAQEHDSDNRVTTDSYDNALRPIEHTDAVGAVTRYTYGAEVQRSVAQGQSFIRETDPLGAVTTQWFADGHLRQVDKTAQTGTYVSSTYSYDPAGRLVSTNDGITGLTKYEYTWDNLVSRVVKPDMYDPVTKTNHDVELVSRKFGWGDKVTWERLGGTRITTWKFDAEGKLTDTTTDPGNLNRNVHLIYNKRGQLTSQIATGGGKSIQVDYCPTRGGAAQCQRINGAVGDDLLTSYVRDETGNATQTITPAGQAAAANDPEYGRTDYTYDALGRMITNTAPKTSGEENGQPATDTRAVTTYGYDVFGDITEARDAKGRTTVTDYDSAGRPLAVHYPGYTRPGASSGALPTTLRNYNTKGQVTQQTDARGQVTDYSYDIAGRLTQVQGPVNPSGVRPTTTYRYNFAGQLLTVVGALGERTDYDYDQLGRRIAFYQSASADSDPDKTPAISRTSWVYDAVGNLLSVRAADEATTTYDHDALGEVTQVHTPGHSTPAKYSYDLAGHVTKAIDEAGRITETEYDNAERPVRVRHRAPDATVLDESSTAYGDGTTIITTAPSGAKTQIQLDVLGRTLSYTQWATPTKTITASYGYDVLGELTRATDGQGNTTVYTYNRLGKVETVTEPATTAHPNLSDRQWTAAYDPVHL